MKNINTNMNELIDNLVKLTSWENAKEILKVKLSNNKAVKEDYMTCPSFVIDASFVYYLELDNNHAIAVTKAIFNSWNIELKEFHKTAMENTLKDIKPIYGTLMSFMFGGKGRDATKELEIDTTEPYVFSNESKILGAVVLLDNDLMQRIAKAFNGDFMILPSSVHEVIIVNADNDPDQLKDMVMAVNKDVVSINDKLSDHVFRYNANNGLITVVA